MTRRTAWQISSGWRPCVMLPRLLVVLSLAFATATRADDRQATASDLATATESGRTASEHEAPQPPASPPDWEAAIEPEPEIADEEEPNDPLEPINRVFFGFNRLLDRALFNPIGRFYGFIVPDPAKRGVQRFFANLNAPVVFVNDLLQLAPRRAGETGARFVINTSAGIAGVWDVARCMGLNPHHADFGQTMAYMHIGSGPYVVLPIMGPSTARDAVGGMIDSLLRLDTWLLSPGGRILIAAGGGVSTKEAHLTELEELERSSVDFYAALRLVYLQHREAEIRAASD